MMLLNYYCLVIFAFFVNFCESKNPQPTLFVNNRVYALQNQHAGNYLTAGKGGIPNRTPDQGSHSISQLWKVMAISREGFKIVPLNGEPALDTLWTPIYIGHGNYHLRNSQNGNCLVANQGVVESRCDKENLYQEWFPTMKEDKEIGHLKRH